MAQNYFALQTTDGIIVDASHDQGDLKIRAEFPVPAWLNPDDEEMLQDVRFAARSRIARLGIDITPTNSLTLEGNSISLEATVRAVIPDYKLGTLLHHVFVPGLSVGRLVACPARRRLDAEGLLNAYSTHQVQLPAAFSIASDGTFTLQPNRVTYRLTRTLDQDGLLSILARGGGKALLNRLQVPTTVDNIVLQPGHGVITSCTMFLHRHYVVLHSDSSPLGRHMHAVVLDPIRTRGPQVFLEFYNDSDEPIVNPSATGALFNAEVEFSGVQSWYGPVTRRSDNVAEEEFADLAMCLDQHHWCEENNRSYFNRPVAILDDGGSSDARNWSISDLTLPETEPTLPAESMSAMHRLARPASTVARFGTRVLESLADNAGQTLLLRYFPNLSEHIDIVTAATRRAINRLIFQEASYEHGQFLSARDHGRLADYADLDLDVYWQNVYANHLARHVFRERRGYFCRIACESSFTNALVFCIFGSSVSLPESEQTKLQALEAGLRSFFGEDVAILTGGGPGAMHHAASIAGDLGLLIGANLLEIEAQPTQNELHFYQVFQETSRHARQRWFEIGSFPIFCVGGVGTLEEVGMTLTDIKLGLAEGTPVVFYGRSPSGQYYWESLVDQLRLIVDDGRGPDWLKTRVILTDDADEVVSFYKRVLGLG